MHTGNIDIETVQGAVDLSRFIGDRDYTALTVSGDGSLSIILNLRRWEGVSGHRLFMRALGCVWRVFRGKLCSEWMKA